jgi:periodic tryptophan protein 2
MNRFNHRIPAVKFSPDGRLIAFAKDNGVLVYRAPSIVMRQYSPFSLERVYQGCHAPSCLLDWSSDSRFLLIGCEDGRVTVFPVGKCTQFGIQNVPSHNVRVMGCFFAEKSLDFYSVAENGHLCVWESTVDMEEISFDDVISEFHPLLSRSIDCSF